ncbi:hypothetical protein [Actinophytocola sediminis]
MKELFLDRMKRLFSTFAAMEPARLAERARALLVLLVGAGWLTIDNATITTVASVAGLVASWLLSRFVRGRVTPVAKLD